MGGHSHREAPKTSRWRASYVTFERCRDMPGIWKYRGHCFRGETVERGQDPVLKYGGPEFCWPPVLWSKGNVKRLPELDRLVQSAYGDKVMGRVPENLCVQLLNGYEVERAAKQERRKVLCELLSARREKE